MTLEQAIGDQIIHKPDTLQFFLEKSMQQLQYPIELRGLLALEGEDASILIASIQYKILDPLLNPIQIIFDKQISELLSQLRLHHLVLQHLLNTHLVLLDRLLKPGKRRHQIKQLHKLLSVLLRPTRQHPHLPRLLIHHLHDDLVGRHWRQITHIGRRSIF